MKPNRDRAGRLTVGCGVTSSAGGCVSCCSDATLGARALPKRFFFALIASVDIKKIVQNCFPRKPFFLTENTYDDRLVCLSSISTVKLEQLPFLAHPLCTALKLLF